ncbi:MAG: CBS domain-containing protein [Deltaproteobacteria bacterium]|nr:CBS domain-containing protein [Deltaproteobacteria bacterium]MBW2317922.1 CBS domain-containing protein [Deltaproteobacteria bacterium]MBW2600420.1 CBS domain-containing protein [Deltaproteobacteria bacterium]
MMELPLDKVLDFLKRVSPFSGLPEPALKDVVGTLLIDYFPRGEVIVSSGNEEEPFLYLVFSGVARCFAENGSTTEILRYVSKGDHFGSEIILTGRCDYTAEVQEDMICYLVRPEVFKDLQGRFEGFEQYFRILLEDPLGAQISACVEAHGKSDFPMSWREKMTASPFETSIDVLARKEPVCCERQTAVSEVAGIMGVSGVGSVIVMEDGTPVGIVTKNDLIQKILARQRSSDIAVSEIMTKALISMDHKGSCFEASLRMLENRCHHMVATKRDRIQGVISQQDLILLQGANPVAVVGGIEKQEDISGIKKCIKDIFVVQQVLLAQGGRIEDIWALMSTFRDRLTMRLLALGIEELKRKGKEFPVFDFSWVTFGTPGRRETLLRKNCLEGFIYKDPEDDVDNRQESAISYVKQLALMVREGLLECGLLHKKNGRVLCLPESRWRRHMMSLMDGKTPITSDHLRMFDIRGVLEQREMIDSFRAFVIGNAARKQEFLDRVKGRNNPDVVPLCFYGNKVVTSNGYAKKLALKNEVLTPLVDAVRVLALEKGVMAFSTIERIKALSQEGVLTAEKASDLQSAYGWLMEITLYKALEAENSLDWILDPYECSSDEKRLLTECFRLIRDFVQTAS